MTVEAFVRKAGWTRDAACASAFEGVGSRPGNRNGTVEHQAAARHTET